MYYHQALARAMADQGITDVFGVLGDANLYVMEAWERAGGRYVARRPRGCRRAGRDRLRLDRDKVGVATVTHGPALTNALTALVDATRARMPVLVIAGDTNPEVRGHLQSIDQHSVVQVSGAGWEPATTPPNVATDLARALRRAWAESRPIVLNIPITFQWAEVDYVPVPPSSVRHRRTRPDQDALEEAAGILASARRPVVLGGRGARHSRDQLRRARRAARRPGGDVAARQGPVLRPPARPRHLRDALARDRAGHDRPRRLRDRLRRHAQRLHHGRGLAAAGHARDPRRHRPRSPGHVVHG